FRRSISTIIPEMTKAALLTKNNVDVPEKDNAAKRKYIYYLSRADYEQEWGTQYERPGVFARVLAFLFKLVPKVGPFKAVAFQTPSTQTEDLYVKSLDNTIGRYKERLNQMRAEADPRLPDINFDTGEPTKAGKYKLTDDSYAYLLGKLSDRHFDLLTADLRGNVLSYYGNLAGPLDTKPRKDEYARLQQRLQELKMAHTVGSEAIAGKSGN